uniref:SCP domain-containing protein n=1 Tax=Strongyloides papillosus TaxID=174720 RepID=A0A0N5CC82_STREA
MIKSDDLLVRSKRQKKSKKDKVPSIKKEPEYATVGPHRHSSENDSLHFKKNGVVYARVNKSRHNSYEDHTYMSMREITRDSQQEPEYMSMKAGSYESIYAAVRGSSHATNRGSIYVSLRFSSHNSIRQSQSGSEPIYATFNEPLYASIKGSINSRSDGRKAQISVHPYDVIKHKVNGLVMYECNDFLFTSSFFAKIYSRKLKSSNIRNPSEIPIGSLYRKISEYRILEISINGKPIFECGPYGFPSLKDAKEYREKIYSNINKKSFKLPRGTLLKSEYMLNIIWYEVNSKKIFECGNYAFATIRDAQQYSKLLRANPSQKVEYPKNCIGESRHKISDFDITVFLGTNKYSYKIWSSIWRKCDFLCFSFNRFQILREKLLLEINTYRKKHGSSKLKYTFYLEKEAQKHANYIIVTGKIARSSDDSYFGTVIGVSYYLAANTIAKKWYDESSKFGFFLGRAKPGTQMFTQMIWKSSTRVGLGVAMSEDVVVVVAKFYPKGNQKRKYITNVLPRGL